jgi:hypothetical protein
MSKIGISGLHMASASKGMAMGSGIEGLIAKYGPLVGGWMIGTGAKYGLVISEGRKVTGRMIVADLLLMGLVVLLSRWLVEWLNLNPAGAATIAAMIGIQSEPLIRMVRIKFLKRVEQELDEHVTGRVRQVAGIEQSARNLKEEGVNAPSTAAKMAEISKVPTKQQPPLS